MTKEEILKEIKSLCAELDDVTTDVVFERLRKESAKAAHVHWKLDKLIVACHQELSFLHDYIDANVI